MPTANASCRLLFMIEGHCERMGRNTVCLEFGLSEAEMLM
jgi:hypothetical protein